MTQKELLMAFIAEIKKEFADSNWDYLYFIAERVLNSLPDSETGNGEWISVNQPPTIGDEYLVVYDLKDGGEPLTTCMQYDAQTNEWHDERGAGVKCDTVLFWKELPPQRQNK